MLLKSNELERKPIRSLVIFVRVKISWTLFNKVTYFIKNDNVIFV